jgi:hypothetical protein
MRTLLQNSKSIFFLIYKARQCTNLPPSPWLGIDMDWPLKKQTLGTIVTYNCPIMTKTNKEELASTYYRQFHQRFYEILAPKIIMLKRNYRDQRDLILYEKGARKMLLKFTTSLLHN